MLEDRHSGGGWVGKEGLQFARNLGVAWGCDAWQPCATGYSREQIAVAGKLCIALALFCGGEA